MHVFDFSAKWVRFIARKTVRKLSYVDSGFNSTGGDIA